MKRSLAKILSPIIVLFVLVNGPVCAATRHEKAFVDITMIPAHTGQPGELTLDSLEAAQILRILPIVERLRAVPPSSAPSSKNISQMRLLVICKMMAASEEVRKAVAAINRDLAASYVALDELTTKQDRMRNMITTATFTQGGILGTLGKSGHLAGYPPQDAVKLVTGASIATGLSVINVLATPRVWTRRVDSGPNSMTPFMNLNFNPKDASQSYLWRYFNEPVLGSTLSITRRELLLKHWKAFLGFDVANKMSVKKMTGLPDGSENLTEGIGLVNKRIALLHDLKSHVEEFDTSLNELHKSIEN